MPAVDLPVVQQESHVKMNGSKHPSSLAHLPDVVEGATTDGKGTGGGGTEAGGGTAGAGGEAPDEDVLPAQHFSEV